MPCLRRKYPNRNHVHHHRHYVHHFYCDVYHSDHDFYTLPALRGCGRTRCVQKYWKCCLHLSWHFRVCSDHVPKGLQCLPRASTAANMPWFARLEWLQPTVEVTLQRPVPGSRGQQTLSDFLRYLSISSTNHNIHNDNKRR